jgi:hypothetical protein
VESSHSMRNTLARSQRSLQIFSAFDRRAITSIWSVC